MAQAVNFKKIVIIIFILAVIFPASGCLVHRNVSVETLESSLEPLVENALVKIELAYASGNAQDFMKLLDKDFEARGKFASVLESYFNSVTDSRLHLAIDMVIADKNGINVRLHWLKTGVTGSGIAIRMRGKSQFLFKKYPQGLSLMRITQENPFF